MIQRTMFKAASMLVLTAAHDPALAETERYLVFGRNARIGHMTVEREGNRAAIVTDIKVNGRGPTINETLVLDQAGLPASWKITGNSNFGGAIAEEFSRTGAAATWKDSTGPGQSAAAADAIYVAQSSGPWTDGVNARALLSDSDRKKPALPGGELRIEPIEAVTLAGPNGPVKATAYFIGGVNTTPSIVVLAGDGALIATPSINGVTVREGFEGEETRLRKLAAEWEGERLGKIRREVAHRYSGPVRIGNVRIFDPATKTVGDPVSVVVRDNKIAGVEAFASAGGPGETFIDGKGGTLVPGMAEMHEHFSERSALLNLAAGITTIRDMGSHNASLDEHMRQIAAGKIDGPRIVRAGMIEGKSPFNNNAGILADSEKAAVDAVNWYADRGYPWIKIYSSVNPAWVPAMAKQAKARGMRVIGHVPAFTTADAMIAAGYDEITHINQLALSWIIDPAKEDTRTLFRLTALKRLPGLDLDSAAVDRTLDAMVANKVALDPTLVTLEVLMTDRDGAIPARAIDRYDHMPIGNQRELKQAVVDLSQPGDDEAYRNGFRKFVALLKLAHQRGVMIVPGTDRGGSFNYHRELELYQQIGMTPADILARATLEMAKHLRQDDRLGSIEAGKLADFFLVPGDPTKDLKAIRAISMVVKDGTVYFPSEIYPHFGIKPFAKAPTVTGGTVELE